MDSDSNLLDMPIALRNSWREGSHPSVHSSSMQVPSPNMSVFHATNANSQQKLIHINNTIQNTAARNLTLPPIMIPSEFEPQYDFGRTLEDCSGIPFSHVLQTQSPMSYQPPMVGNPTSAQEGSGMNRSKSSTPLSSPTPNFKEAAAPSELVPIANTRNSVGYKYVNVTPFLHLPQHEAAKELGVPSSTLSKRWREATMNRNWPHRILRKLDKQIHLVLKNRTSSPNGTHTLENEIDITQNLPYLLAKRREEAKVVYVRL